MFTVFYSFCFPGPGQQKRYENGARGPHAVQTKTVNKNGAHMQLYPDKRCRYNKKKNDKTRYTKTVQKRYERGKKNVVKTVQTKTVKKR